MIGRGFPVELRARDGIIFFAKLAGIAEQESAFMSFERPPIPLSSLWIFTGTTSRRLNPGGRSLLPLEM